MEKKWIATLIFSFIIIGSAAGFFTYRWYTDLIKDDNSDDGDNDDDIDRIPIEPKEDLTDPVININFPEQFDQFGNTPPNFTIMITEENLDTSWYRIENGTHYSENMTFTGDSNIQIDQVAWDCVGNGTVSINFYVNDTAGNLGFNEISIRKNIYDPIITILNPLTNNHFRKTSPIYNVIKGEGLYPIDFTWYSLYNGTDWSSNHTFSGNSGTINETLWNNTVNGYLKLRFYINDSQNTVTFDDVNISKICNIINHECAHLDDLISIPIQWIENAKSNLQIVYWHTSHGSQLTSGMSPLDTFMGGTDLYEYNYNGLYGALHLFEPDDDDGYPYEYRDLTEFTDKFHINTSMFLDANSGYNVVMWSWCGLDKDSAAINQYLLNMNQTEYDYPDVKFVYMTAHLEGTGEEGDLHYYNEIIRDYCIKYNKILYDFADIESYDPDDIYFNDKNADDGCYYDNDNDGIIEYNDEANWAIQWQNSHNGDDIQSNGGEWYNCYCEHSQSVNGNMKAFASWYLFSYIAGWKGN